MNAKIMTRLAVFAVAGSLLAGCATQQGTNTAVGTGVGAGTGAALGAIFGGGKGAGIGARVGAAGGLAQAEHPKFGHVRHEQLRHQAVVRAGAGPVGANAPAES